MSEEVRLVPPDKSGTQWWSRFTGSNALMAITAPLVILLLWESAARLGLLDTRFFPTPSSVVVELASMAASGELAVHLGWTLQRVLIGFVLGAVPGVLLGLILGLSPGLNALIKPAIAVIYPIPKVALFPLIMLIFGLGETSKWVIVGIAVFFQVFFSTLAGVVNIERIYLDVAVNFGASRWQAYRTIALPAALPFIFAGCQLGLGMALIVVVVAEQFGTKTGLGFIIWRSWQIFEVRDMFVGLIMVALVGYGSQLAMTLLESRLIRWKPRNRTRSQL
jgi:NitT/TauT family transport system permease protein